MKSMIAAVAFIMVGASARAADSAVPFAGEWKTTAGPVTLEKKGDGVAGKFVAFNLALTGKVEDQGKKLAISYVENGTKVESALEFDPSGNAFTALCKASNGNQWTWSGWRADPSAAKGKPADFSGLWLTEMGLMELAADGPKVKGRYALRGTSSLDGTVSGRHLEFKFKTWQFTGPGFFDLDEKNTSLAGAGGADGNPRWYGWKGRRAPEYTRHTPLVAGQIVDGSTENLLTYSVRAPEGYKPGDAKKWPVALILHGSNMNGKAYVNTVAVTWPDIARDFILLGINGETPSNLAKDNPQFNFTYVNFMGKSTYKGYPGTDRESPALVREAMEDLKKVYPIKDFFVGGHSQGGFLTYALMMNSPDLIAGAFPTSAGLLMQAEPAVFDDTTLKKAQRSVPLAIVHGKNDPNPQVPFDGAAYAHDTFLDAGWRAVRLFADDNAGHMFARLPVGQAIRWLEALASDDPKVLLDFAERRLAESSPRDAIAAIKRARGMKLDAATMAKLDSMKKTIDGEAAPRAKTFLGRIKANTDRTWIDPFLIFRDEFEYADAAGDAMAAFDELRAKHNPPAAKAMGEARQAFNQGRRPDGYAKAQEVVDKYYASSAYRLARKWVAEQK